MKTFMGGSVGRALLGLRGIVFLITRGFESPVPKKKKSLLFLFLIELLPFPGIQLDRGLGGTGVVGSDALVACSLFFFEILWRMLEEL
jgi:hypothetical protein